MQFMVHDWISHGPGSAGEEMEVPLADPTTSPRATRADADRDPAPARLGRADRPRPRAGVFGNTETSLVGRLPGLRQRPGARGAARSGEGGRLTIGDDGLLPAGGDAAAST